MESVENMEECLLSLLLANEEVNVIDEEYIGIPVLVLKLINGIIFKMI